MNSDTTSSNISFEYLGRSADFLNIVLNNITCCVLMLNHRMELQAYNDALKTIFVSRQDEDIIYKRCGEVIGCAFSVEEEKDCGTTSQCEFCELRKSALDSYINKQTVFRKRINREFYTSSKVKRMKYLQFSTRPFYFEENYYIILMIEDISRHVEQEILIENQAYELSRFLNEGDKF